MAVENSESITLKNRRKKIKSEAFVIWPIANFDPIYLKYNDY